MSPAQVREALATQLRALPNWSEIPAAPDVAFSATARVIPPAFSVGLGATEFRAGRQVRGGATLAETEVVIRFVVTLPADGHGPDAIGATSYDAALAKEAELLDALLGQKHRPDGLPLTIRGVDRGVSGEGAYYTGTVRAAVNHMYPSGV